MSGTPDDDPYSIIDVPAGAHRSRVLVDIPDRPGALGSVASRMGALRVNIVAVRSLENPGAGTMLVEFIVDLDQRADIEALLRIEVAEAEGLVRTVEPLG